MILSNQINEHVCLDHYKFDPSLIVIYNYLNSTIDLPIIDCKEEWRLVTQRPRRPQTRQLLARLRAALTPCQHDHWLAARGVVDTTGIYGVDYDILTAQELLDLYLCPDDHILDAHGVRPVVGPVFLDERDGALAGVCVRNVSTDLAYVKDAKYTFTNFGWFLYGYDLYGPDADVVIVEGVFDALALRQFGYCAIAVGCCMPQPYQLACLVHKFRSLSVCFDSDFWGHYGAYVTATSLKAPIYIPELKDISCHFETGQPLRLRPITLPELCIQLCNEIADYNRKVAAGEPLVRHLPYNTP